MPSLELDIAGKIQRISLKTPGVLGRESECEFFVEHATISRRHAEFHVNDGEVVLVDLGSANGTRVNGEKLVGPRRLVDLDTVEFGGVSARFRQAADTVAARTVAPPTQEAIRVEALSFGAFAHDQLIEKLLDLVDSGEVYQALDSAMKQFLGALPVLEVALVFDQMDGRIRVAHPLESKRPAGMLRQALLAAEGRPKQFSTSERAALAQEHQVLPREFQFVVDLGRARGVGLALYLDGGSALSESTLIAVTLAARVLRQIVRRFDRSTIAQVSDEDLKLGERIQRRMLKSDAPKLPGFRTAVSYLPALAVGGDFYDFAINRSGELVIAIGDVSGKGVSASLYMSYLMAGLREHAPTAKGPSELISTMNKWLVAVLEPGLFATMTVCFVDSKKAVCRFAQAGHAPPVLRSAARKVIDLGSDPGAPLGAADEIRPKEVRLTLSSGDLLLFTTDGVEEGENQRGEAFGNDRRDDALKRVNGALAGTLAVREALLDFVGAATSTDDMTIIALERE